MAKIKKTVHIDVFGKDGESLTVEQTKAVKQIVRNYGGKVSAEPFSTFVCARVRRARVSHLKGTLTKKNLVLDIDAE
jgi:hypothetical protein